MLDSERFELQQFDFIEQFQQLLYIEQLIQLYIVEQFYFEFFELILDQLQQFEFLDQLVLDFWRRNVRVLGAAESR
jgi:hypothetical protein